MTQKDRGTDALADRAYSSLRELIIRGRLAPGARGFEVELATRLSISRPPIREALRRLAHDGFLIAPTDSQRRRFVEAPLTGDDVRDLYSIMGALEGAVGRNVVRLSSVERRELARRLVTANGKLETVARQRSIDLDRIFEAHNSFHHIFVNACGTLVEGGVVRRSDLGCEHPRATGRNLWPIRANLICPAETPASPHDSSVGGVEARYA